MCLNGNHASPSVLPKNHFHSTQACGESAPSTAICVTLHPDCRRTSLLEVTLWPTLGPAGLLDPQRSRQGASAEDRQFVLASLGSQNRAGHRSPYQPVSAPHLSSPDALQAPAVYQTPALVVGEGH